MTFLRMGRLREIPHPPRKKRGKGGAPGTRRCRRYSGCSERFFGPFPGRLAGFSWVFSRKTPRMPPARPKLPIAPSPAAEPGLPWSMHSESECTRFPGCRTLPVCFIKVDRTGLRGTSFHRFHAAGIFYLNFYPNGHPSESRGRVSWSQAQAGADIQGLSPAFQAGHAGSIPMS